MGKKSDCVPDAEAVRNAVVRLCASSGFSAAPKRTAFLRFVVERVLNDDAASLKAYTIGVGALGRTSEFNPATDPIVRVEAGRLREALTRYYAGEGVLDPLIVSLPRGGYVPKFAWRETSEPIGAGASSYDGNALGELMKILRHAGRTLLGADGVTLVLRDGEDCYYADEDAIGPLWKGKRFPMSTCISGWCMAQGKAVAIKDIYQDSRIPIDSYRTSFVRSLAMAPVSQDHPIAAVGVYWSAIRELSPEELDLLQSVANLIAPTVARLELRQKNFEESASA